MILNKIIISNKKSRIYGTSDLSDLSIYLSISSAKSAPENPLPRGDARGDVGADALGSGCTRGFLSL